MTRHRILLAVTGLSPQIVTETLYALCVTQNPPWVPDEIRLITSKEGAERARLDLLDPVKGQFHAFCQDYPQAVGIDFRPENIHTMTRADDTALDDIRTPEDNALAADAIHALVQKLTADPATELHVSIAGGRKTMGFYLGYCLSLYARAQDKLSHVLVSAPFEGLADFYFPPREGVLLHTRDGRPIHTDDAKVMLAEIPFVHLRQILPATALNPAQRFSDAVAATQTHLDKTEVTLFVSNKTLRCGTRTVHLQPQLFAFYLWMAERARAGKPPIRHTDADPAEFLLNYERVVGKDAVDYEATADLFAREQGVSKEFFEQKRAKINKALNAELALSARVYLIAPFGERPLTRYGLKLASNAIGIV
ncbi:CRISPR-associated protein [Betaproteobacteria bacterium]|nr:CRISPR-associated protein [Betaproteobacteria bacterium]GHU25824.1 CRISPR-associated protein [Betaproteobacteria bacterium]